MIWIPGILSQCGVRLPPKGKALNDYTWEELRLISDAGKASEYFSVGDRKAVILNGTAGRLNFSNKTFYCYIIGIDHNSAKEGANRIHFQFGYTAASGGVHIAFIDSVYNRYSSSSCFNMNDRPNNSGGWESSHMRTTIIPTFKTCLPSELQAVLKTVTKYSDNTGDGSNTASYVTATTDDIFLLSEFEVFGTRRYANSAEENYQEQYAYYSAGNSKRRYRHSSTRSTANWWLRSVRANNDNAFCYVNTNESVSSLGADHSYGFAPAFCV